MLKKLFHFLLLVAVACLLNSCARTPPIKKPPLPLPEEKSTVRQDVVHTVGPGETFWRIAKMYDVPMATIMSINHIINPQDLKMGQQLKIPQAAQLKPIIPLFPSKKWQYIIIHHSATEEGNALAFHMSHRAKGWDSVGYDFVIDNGTGGKQDGQVEATPRWIKQLDGAHCKASEMNTKAIGICLVGNFNQEAVSKKQMDSLIYLVKTLKNQYQIHDSHIMGHGQVPQASTECPGTNFPWEKFWEKLK